jgi:hypothetical protein
LIAIGTAVVAAALIVVTVVAQRVQTDPLIVGAEQVARLSLDSSFDIPGLFFGFDEQGGARAFQEFHGIRPVVSDSRLFSGNEGDDCMTIFSSADLEKATGNSFSGFAMSGCGAGAFPAVTQFTLVAQNVPEELASAFPSSAALQFVYDSVHDEVVVFATE